MVNTDQWDYDRVAALVAPRPLLICNTDKDEIFPLRWGHGNLQSHAGALQKARPRGQYRPSNRRRPARGDAAALHRRDPLDGPLPPGGKPPRNDRWNRRTISTRRRIALAFGKLPTDEKVTTIDSDVRPRRSPARGRAERAGMGAPAQPLAQSAEVRIASTAWPASGPWRRSAQDRRRSRGGRTTPDGLGNSRPEEPFHLTSLDAACRMDCRARKPGASFLNLLDDAGWKRWCAIAAAAFPAQFPEAAPDREGLAGQQKEGCSPASEIIAFFSPRGAGPTFVRRAHAL